MISFFLPMVSKQFFCVWKGSNCGKQLTVKKITASEVTKIVKVAKLPCIATLQR